MAVIFEETQDLIPQISFKIVLVMLLATDAFLLACSFTDLIDGFWQFGAVTVCFAAFLAAVYFIKVRVVIEDGKMTVRMIKTFEVPFERVIDVKKGDIDIMRNYSGWGIKKVKFKNYTVAGIDGAVSVKLTGRMVLTMTTAHPDEIYDILHENRRQD